MAIDTIVDDGRHIYSRSATGIDSHARPYWPHYHRAVELIDLVKGISSQGFLFLNIVYEAVARRAKASLYRHTRSLAGGQLMCRAQKRFMDIFMTAYTGRGTGIFLAAHIGGGTRGRKYAFGNKDDQQRDQGDKEKRSSIGSHNDTPRFQGIKSSCT